MRTMRPKFFKSTEIAANIFELVTYYTVLWFKEMSVIKKDIILTIQVGDFMQCTKVCFI